VHLADGILSDPRVLVGLDLVGGGGLVIAARRAGAEAGRDVAWTGLFGAFLLAAQAVNVPLLPGTSAHAIGAGLVTLTLGPARAVVTLGAVLFIQALLLGDGGLTVLGVNLLNLALLPAFAVELAARVFGRQGRGLAVTAVLGTLLGNVAGATALASALVLGAGASAKLTFPWLVGAQALAGLAEGVLTAIAVREIERRTPRLLFGGRTQGVRAPGAAIAWAAIAVGALTAAIPLASSAPDALERLLPELHAHP